MQIYADVMRRPLHVIDSDAGPALGSAIHAAVAAGFIRTSDAAAAAMGKGAARVHPDDDRADAYDGLYAHYAELHDHFGARRR